MTTLKLLLKTTVLPELTCRESVQLYLLIVCPANLAINVQQRQEDSQRLWHARPATTVLKEQQLRPRTAQLVPTALLTQLRLSLALGE